jgi:pseudo-rSAM protein
MKSQQIFYLYSHVHYSKVDNKILLYNTKTGEYMETDSLIGCRLIDDVYKPENLGTINLTGIYLENDEAINVVNNIIKRDFGRVINVESDMPEPINLLPILNLQDDVDRLKGDKEHNMGEKSLYYLNELNIYLNNSCSLNCSYCDLYSKQTKSCYKEKRNVNIQPIKIKEILNSLEYSSLKNINFLGGNIFLYPYWNELTELLRSYDFDFHYWIHIENMQNENRILGQKKEMIINFPVNRGLVEQYTKTHRSDEQINYHFFIEEDTQYNELELIVKTYNINNYKIVPIYTGSNISFFENNIYLEKKDIFSTPIPHRIIFCNQKLNSNYFGKLYILSDGSVKANMNVAILGNIYKNSILEIIEKELIKNTAWRIVRTLKPCNQCLYQYLCPPPSNYETIIGKPNLCHVKS